MEPMALWSVAPHQAEIRPGAEGVGVLVHTLFSGISRGTERLVFEGRVPESEWLRMRAPAQEGDFPFPVKYGYSAVGVVAEGELAGQTVFALHPHQSEFRLESTLLNPLPDGLPPERAVLGANMETALTVLWDSGVSAGDRVAIVGAGVIGSLTGYLAARIPGTTVTLVDVNPGREALARTVGCGFALEDDAPDDNDVVIHTSATESGLSLAIKIAGNQARVVEASWHGQGAVSVPLGGAFHSKRLTLRSSQVGNLPPERVPRWTHRRRLKIALNLLRDPALDALISGETPFVEMPSAYPTILSDPETLCHRIRYRTP